MDFLSILEKKIRTNSFEILSKMSILALKSRRLISMKKLHSVCTIHKTEKIVISLFELFYFQVFRTLTPL